MAEKPDRSQVRKALWDLISQAANRAQEESRQTLSKADALTAAMGKYPTLATAYTDAVRRGDPPSDVYPAEPVAKAAPAAHEQLFATITKRAEALAARTGMPNARAVADVFAADPDLYEKYRAAVSKRSKPATPRGSPPAPHLGRRPIDQIGGASARFLRVGALGEFPDGGPEDHGGVTDARTADRDRRHVDAVPGRPVAQSGRARPGALRVPSLPGGPGGPECRRPARRAVRCTARRQSGRGRPPHDGQDRVSGDFDWQTATRRGGGGVRYV